MLLSQSTSRVVAGGDSINSHTDKSLIFGGLVGGYANLASDALVATVLFVNGDYWHFSLMVICITLPAVLHATVQLSKRFYASAARSFFFFELLHASVESYSTSTKTSTFMSLIFFETAMQCIPSAVLKDSTLACAVGFTGMHITRNPLHSVSEGDAPANGLPARLAAHSRAGSRLSVQSRAAPSSPTVRHNPLA